MRLRKLLPLSLVVVLSMLVGGCGGVAVTPTAASGEVVVFAASSLKDAFGVVGDNLNTAGLVKATFNFAGSQTLVTQLSQGARADVFVSADAKTMDAAIVSGEIASGTQKLMATNRLVVITEPDNGKVSKLQDIAAPGLKLVVAGPSVPAGNYSLQMLDKLSADPAYGAGFKDAVLANVVSREDNVRQVVAKVQLGEADAGIVYVTDAAGGKVGKIDIPAQYNVPARYYIAPLKNASNPAGAKRFVDYVLSEAGQSVLKGFGFGPADEGE
ncbi:MAG: molybdate ABC transporter substrate-binding protein [Chloroflexota bacterium]